MIINILLTGGSGFIGTEILGDLKKFGTVLVTNRSNNHQKDISINIDFNDPKSINNIYLRMKKIDIVVFLIGLAHEKGSKATESEHIKTNYQTLANLINSMKLNNCLPNKIIFASTISVYGERQNITSYSEETDTMPVTPYAVSKRMAEEFLIDNYSSISWILRLAPVYSKVFLLNIDRRTKVFNKYYKVGSGNRMLSLCNVKNISLTINGIINNNVPSGVYNISDTKYYTYNDLLKFQSANHSISIPALIIWLLYYFGILIKNNFLIENSIKLFTDNVYPPRKLSENIKLDYDLSDL